MTLIERAKDFAHRAHDSISHKRKYGDNPPYWVHTDEVADIVAEHGGTARQIAAAHLHDVLEDVDDPSEENHPFGFLAIDEAFGHEIAMLVFHLTDIFTSEHFPKLNRERRKGLERARLQFIPNEAMDIKLADMISNTRDIIAMDKNFAKVYVKEMIELLPNLRKGKKGLYDRAKKQLDDYESTRHGSPKAK